MAEAARERLARRARQGNSGSEGSEAPLRSSFNEWHLRNPLNLIPLAILFVVIAGLAQMVFGL